MLLKFWIDDELNWRYIDERLKLSKTFRGQQKDVYSYFKLTNQLMKVFKSSNSGMEHNVSYISFKSYLDHPPQPGVQQTYLAYISRGRALRTWYISSNSISNCSWLSNLRSNVRGLGIFFSKCPGVSRGDGQSSNWTRHYVMVSLSLVDLWPWVPGTFCILCRWIWELNFSEGLGK